MPIAVQLPALSPTMSEGRITKWLKQKGDTVTSGDAIAECETDKSNLEIEAYDDGVLLDIVVKEGQSAPIGATIGWIGRPGEAIPPSAPPIAASTSAPPIAASTSAPAISAGASPGASPGTGPGPGPGLSGAAAPRFESPRPAAVIAPPQSGAVESRPAPHNRVRASPLARKLAAAQGVDLAGVRGSGPSGRIVKRDVLEVVNAKPPSLRGPTPGPRVEGRAPPQQLPLSQIRKVIAQRLGEVKPGVPHFYQTVEIEMDQALALRAEAKELGLKVTVNDIVVKAVGLAVRRFPRINQVFAGDHLLQLNTVDVGVAVAIDDGLVTPMVRDADAKGISQIAEETRELAERARKKALRPEEYSGGSITVSNLGMYGISSFIAVLNPPQAAILAVGAAEPKVVVREGQMVIRQMMSVTLSGDHRVIDGAVGAQFLKELRALLEHPLRLAL